LAASEPVKIIALFSAISGDQIAENSATIC